MSDLIAVAMSGGVDSSTVAALLKRDGYNIAGLTMQLWNQRRLPELSQEPVTGRCCSLDDVYDARRVADGAFGVNDHRRIGRSRPRACSRPAGRVPRAPSRRR